LHRISFGLIALLSAGDLLMIYLDNKGLILGEKALVALARASDEPIYTDPATLGGATFLLNYTAPGHKVISGMAPAGGLFFYNPSPTRLEFHRDSVGKCEPRSTWTLLRSITEDLPIQLAQAAQPPREAAGHDWRRRARCLSLADRR
jgi:hypothetical protein